MTPEDVILLFSVLEKISESFDLLLVSAFLLTGILSGILLIFIFLFFLKGAE